MSTNDELKVACSAVRARDRNWAKATELRVIASLALAGAALFADPAGAAGRSSGAGGTSAAGVVSPKPPTRLSGSAVTRADLAGAYLVVDRAVMAKPPAGETLAEINRRFDLATIQFFAGDRGAAIATLHEIGWSVASPAPPSNAERALSPLKAVATPSVVLNSGGASTRFSLVELYTPPPGDVDGEVRLRLVRDSSDDAALAVGVLPLRGRNEERALEFTIPKDTACGRWNVEASVDGASRTIGAISIVDETPSVTKARLLQRLAALEATEAVEPPVSPRPPDQLHRDQKIRTAALATFTARANLLSDAPSASNSAEFLVDPCALSAALEQELAALESGKDPYLAIGGDLWRVFRAGPVDLPTRVFLPPASDEPVPLLIALHGAGGDENMFMDAYGGGRLRQLAEQHGFALAAPQTTGFMVTPAFFDSIVDTLAAERPIDRDRIVVLGHSLGGGAAMRLAGQRGEKLAGWAAIAGAGATPSGSALPPGLVVLAENDAVVPTPATKAQIEKAIAGGAPIELRVMNGWGHTLVVGAVLDDVVSWLMERRRSARDAP